MFEDKELLRTSVAYALQGDSYAAHMRFSIAMLSIAMLSIAMLSIAMLSIARPGPYSRLVHVGLLTRKAAVSFSMISRTFPISIIPSMVQIHKSLPYNRSRIVLLNEHFISDIRNT
jgi:hypothetical protein